MLVLQDFLLSRKAKLCSPSTIEWYERMLKPFVSDYQLTSRGVRAFIAGIADRDVEPSTVHAYARAVRAFVRFAYREGYIDEEIEIDMPRKRQKHMPTLDQSEIQDVLEVCTVRDRAMVLLLLDSGMRRGEALALDWQDIDFDTGSVLIRNGKGGKARTAAIGIRTRRALIKWRRENEGREVFSLKASGCSTLFTRLSEKSGVHIHPHKCRRTFATLALRNGINLFALQRLMGHSTLEMTRRYAEQIDSDLLEAHREAGPVDSLLD